MGAPKQKWTKEEEAALRAGIDKYGPGKWSAILKDPLLSTYLASRSNVDLKDKWRNINVTANGWGSREKARLAFKKSSQLAKQSGRHLLLGPITNGRSNVPDDAKQLVVVDPSLHSTDSMRSIPRVDTLIMDAIASLKEPRGSSKSTIAAYIEMGQNYMLNRSFLHGEKGTKITHLLQEELEGKHIPSPYKNPFKRLREEIRLPTKFEIEAELSKMTMMSAEESAKFAAEAVADAELLMTEAEEAGREADAAEADAEAAQAFAEAAMMNLRNSKNSARSWR
ncbi:telomere repeat-binding factor 1 isoform X4 [Cryptomeria japonica]|uniref:telomere repeat-binding factor 1 isoform X4 n=1 Tax=Cryptomeria japonica TaxID=3369 RepID=UPI0027DA4F97|nr:telomere repeat-binding factor 1 isoform X4 [Cryptomeria japonica]